jgi:glutathione S-transferase
MSVLRLVIGNKNYSSWSMRPWVAMKACGIPFEEALIPLYTGPADKQRILDVSNAGKVPVLVDGDVRVWESLSIIEYLAERFPQAGLWPSDPKRRAFARSICAEMHAGFAALRKECGMNLHRPVAAKRLSEAALADIARVKQIWAECLAGSKGQGGFLFGPFGAADAMFAPVVHRFRSYAIPLEGELADYRDAMLAHPAIAEWTRDGLAETLLIPGLEED